MRIVMFYHSLISDWNHGNAHFLRGVVRELRERGHDLTVYEPLDGWSLTNLLRDRGPGAVAGFHQAYPELRSIPYTSATLDLDRALAGADLVIVHEWNDAAFVRRIGRHRACNAHYRLLFHDTHHRAVTAPGQMAQFGLEHFDGALVFGGILRDIYRAKGWARQVWVWHEAADCRVFRPLERVPNGDIVWVGNWGDEERSGELRQYLIEPVRELRLKATVYGVRYPEPARDHLRAAGIAYRGWLPNYEVPRVFAHFRATVHVPRRPYAEALPGIPTIRVFEALACGIPLVSSPWEDSERLFRVGTDFLMAKSRVQMRECLRMLLNEPALASHIAESGRRRVLAGHTCGHRVNQLLLIAHDLGVNEQGTQTP